VLCSLWFRASMRRQVKTERNFTHTDTHRPRQSVYFAHEGSGQGGKKVRLSARHARASVRERRARRWGWSGRQGRSGRSPGASPGVRWGLQHVLRWWAAFHPPVSDLHGAVVAATPVAGPEDWAPSKPRHTSQSALTLGIRRCYSSPIDEVHEGAKPCRDERDEGKEEGVLCVTEGIRHKE